MSHRALRRLVISLLLGLLTSVLTTSMLVGGWMRPLQLSAGDLLFRLKPDSTARWVTLVAIDDRSLAELRDQGRFFNWPRELHARVIDNLKAAGARMIVWDVLFDAPAPGDEALAAAMQSAGNVILAEVPESRTQLPPTPERPYRYGEAIRQAPAIRQAAHAVGHVRIVVDSDGTVRSNPLIVEMAGEDVPSLALAAVARFLRRPQVIESPIVDGKMEFAGRQIPVDSSGSLWISYLGDSSEVTSPPTFPTLSFIDVLNNQIPPELVNRNRLVVVGITATGYADDYWTPVSRYSKMDGVEIEANAMETILRPEEFIVPIPQNVTIAVVLAAGLLVGLALGLLNPLPSLALGLLVSLAYLGAAVYFVDNAAGKIGYILDLLYPALTLWLAYLLVLFYRILFEQAEQRALKGALSQYLSPDVMEEVVRDPEALKLGGEKREMTVLFMDIRGFTTMSEQLDPERLVRLLNVYLTRMSDVIFAHQGTIDKYMGDAVMAFWGAPKIQPDHARLACLAALEMLETLEKLNADFEREQLPRLAIGVGLSSGPMAVGNMGSARRFDYTVVGDAVNLGARLESLNKEYGTNIVASQRTLELAGAEIRTRFLDLVAVQGKTEPVAVFELLGSNASTNGLPGELLDCYQRGVERYRAREFADALDFFEQAVSLDGQDGPSQMYVQRCQDLLASPPSADWDGIYIMTHK